MFPPLCQDDALGSNFIVQHPLRRERWGLWSWALSILFVVLVFLKGYRWSPPLDRSTYTFLKSASANWQISKEYSDSEAVSEGEKSEGWAGHCRAYGIEVQFPAIPRVWYNIPPSHTETDLPEKRSPSWPTQLQEIISAHCFKPLTGGWIALQEKLIATILHPR